MKNSVVALLLSAVILIMGSCSIEKRVHQRGFHIAKKTSFNKNSKHSSEIVELNNKQQDEVNNEIAQHDAILEETATQENSKIITLQNSDVQEEQESTKTNKSAAAKTKSAKAVIGKKRPIGVQTMEDLALEDVFSTEQKQKEQSSNSLDDTMKILILILCFLLPPVAVWLLTEDIVMLIISILLSLLFWLPGIIFALYHFFQVY